MSASDLYQPYEFAEDFGPEPTDDELAAIDAAPMVEATVSIEEWAQTSWVQTALQVVGPPDGTNDWRLRFVAELLGYHDAVKKAQESLEGLDIERLEEIRQTFDEAVHRYQGVADAKPQALLAEMLSAGLTLKAIASYLQVPAYRLAAMLCPKNPTGLMEVDDLIRRKADSFGGLARRCGVSEDVVRFHARRCRITSEHKGGFWRHSPEVRDRALALHAEGLSYTQIAAKLTDELGTSMHRTTVAYYVQKAKASA